MYVLSCVMDERAQDRRRRERWEAYTANALCSIAGGLGMSFALYTDILREDAEGKKPQQPQDERSGTEILDDMIDTLSGVEVIE